MFVLVIKYEKSIEEVDAVLAEHRAYLQEKYESGHMIASGSQVPRNRWFDYDVMLLHVLK